MVENLSSRFTFLRENQNLLLRLFGVEVAVEDFCIHYNYCLGQKNVYLVQQVHDGDPYSLQNGTGTEYSE